MLLLRILAYFIPFGINFLNGGFFFITAHRFAAENCSRVVVASAITAWGVAYCLTTALSGRLIKSSNALKFILTGGILLTLTSLGFIIFDGLYTQFLWLGLSGIGAALFCTPFQLFAKSVESGSRKSPGTVRATSFYTLTWSLGFASGPLAFARLNNRNGFLVTLILALLVTLSVVMIAVMTRKNRMENRTETIEQKEEKNLLFPAKTYTRLAVLGWIVGGLGTITVSQIRTMWPKLGEELAISRDHIAYVLALVSYVQAFTALSLCKSRSWMWKRFPAILMSAAGIGGLMIFTFCGNLLLFYFGALLFGIYSGCLYFYLVYHSLAHPERSGFFVAGNEVIVGITSMLAPLAGGFLADIFQFTGTAFIFAAVITFIALLAQLTMLVPAKLAKEE